MTRISIDTLNEALSALGAFLEEVFPTIVRDALKQMGYERIADQL